MKGRDFSCGFSPNQNQWVKKSKKWKTKFFSALGELYGDRDDKGGSKDERATEGGDAKRISVEGAGAKRGSRANSGSDVVNQK